MRERLEWCVYLASIIEGLQSGRLLSVQATAALRELLKKMEPKTE